MDDAFCGLIPNPLNFDYVVIADPDEQLLLAPKVQINSSLGDAGMFSDRFYSCRLVSTFGEDLSSGPKNGAAFITTIDNGRFRNFHWDLVSVITSVAD
jgi:hypothetical protein